MRKAWGVVLFIALILALSNDSNATVAVLNSLGEAVGSPGYVELPAAVAAIGTNQEVLRLLPGTYSITSNLAIPNNICLKIQEGAVISVAAGVTLTINGPFQAGLYQVFSCTGTGAVVFGAGGVKSVSPYWWGAKFDGTTVDTAALQEAFNTGVVVEFPEGQTCKTGQLTFTSGLHIEGNNSTLDRDLVSAPGSVGFGGAAEPLLMAATAVNNIIIRRLKFHEYHSQSSTLSRSSIWFSTNLTDVLIEECEFIDDLFGVQVISTPYGQPESAATRVTVRRCKMYGGPFVPDGTAPNYTINGDKLASLGSEATYCVIDNNYVENVGSLCILNARLSGSTPYVGIAQNAHCHITNNICVNTIDSTIYAQGVGIVIANNTVYRPGGVGIVLNNYTDPVTGQRYSYNCTIANNVVQGAGRTSAGHGFCITCWANDSVISGNTLIVETPVGKASSGMGGININATNVAITGNAIYGINGVVSGTYALYLQGAQKCSVTGNTVEDIDHAIDTDNLSNNDRMTITGNRFKDCNYGIYLQSPLSAMYWTVGNNAFDGIVNMGIILNTNLWNSSTYWNISNNQFIGNGASARGISGVGVGRLTLIGNVFSGLRQDDIVLDEGDFNGPIFGSGNVSDGLGTNPYWTASPHGASYLSTGPTVGTWLANEIAYTNPAVSGGENGNVCTASGTLGTLNSGSTTGSIKINTTALVINSATGFYPGCFIIIAGVTGTKKVVAISGTVVTIDSNANATVSNAAVSYSAPKFKTWGAIS